ncbi:MAG: hypothetical protein PHU23_17930, partial [Dehalococcoidales bacterium]|nr:hypothetical protein [Dehalococcoidales bacterium]
QWMARYQDEIGISSFKVAFRTHPYEVAIPILEAYMKQSFTGNYLDLWPTISNLGKTENPQNNVNISCKKLEELDFFDGMKQHECGILKCGLTCGYCKMIYEKAKV